jgi:hypothetical protein
VVQKDGNRFPLQSVERLVELDRLRCRNLPLRICGQLGLQSLTRPASKCPIG